MSTKFGHMGMSSRKVTVEPRIWPQSWRNNRDAKPVFETGIVLAHKHLPSHKRK